MALFTWNDTFNVNVASIDEQHQRLVALINDFHDAIEEGRSHVVLGRVLTDLLDYAEYHFRTEQELMDAHGYPGRSSHAGDHDDFRDRVRHFERIQSWANDGISADIARFLRDWLAIHIKGTDKQLGRFLNSIGVA